MKTFITFIFRKIIPIFTLWTVVTFGALFLINFDNTLHLCLEIVSLIGWVVLLVILLSIRTINANQKPGEILEPEKAIDESFVPPVHDEASVTLVDCEVPQPEAEHASVVDDELPDPTPEEGEFLKTVFKLIATSKAFRDEQIEEAKTKSKKEVDEALSEMMDELKTRIPEHLKEKVFICFKFSKEDSGIYDLPHLYEREMFSSFGITVLGELREVFTKKELAELNKAWYPFVSFNTDYYSLWVGRPDHVWKAIEEAQERLFSLSKES